ncbi:MAG: hypothetical protein MUE99_04170 [Chitinophagaceae bacterium]|jgi:uncharacterized membrane protein YidH (DUF202 family)|nr:hypothetical protein [Chitinophagaceae bacterium]
MDNLPVIKTEEADAPSVNVEKKKKKEDKEEKKDISLDKLELALYRAQLAMIRTATTTTTLGFALYKLMQEKHREGTDGPLMQIFSPKIVSLVLFFAGFLGLISYSFKHVASLKKINRFTPKFYVSGVMMVSYVILMLTFFLFIGALLSG